MDVNVYLQLPYFACEIYIIVKPLLIIEKLSNKALDAYIVNKIPIEKLRGYYHIISLDYKKQSQPHREVKQIPKTKGSS
jgi:hypothetical protein